MPDIVYKCSKTKQAAQRDTKMTTALINTTTGKMNGKAVVSTLRLIQSAPINEEVVSYHKVKQLMKLGYVVRVKMPRDENSVGRAKLGTALSKKANGLLAMSKNWK
jgi:hypothetical protein